MRKLNALLVVCFAMVLGQTVQAQISGGNNSGLKGEYAFSFNGFNVSSSGSSVFAAVGRFTADGAGTITNGVMDTNGVSGVVTTQAFTGSYTIGADGRGTMTLNAAGSTSQLAFAMTSNGNAQFIRFDAAGGAGTVGSGTIEKADTTAFATAKITGDYAFGLAGYDATSNRVAFAGRLTADGAGNFTSGAGDINAQGNVGPAVFTTVSYTVSGTTNGRGTMSMAFTFGGAPLTLHFVFYVVNSGKLLAMETDSLTGSNALPLLSGTVLQQQTPPGGFSNASLNGGMVLSLTGRTVCTSGAAAASDVVAGLLTANGNGGITLTFDENCGGVFSSPNLSGTTTVTPNGRVLITLGTLTEIAYLVSSNQVFFLATDAAVVFGPGDAQTAGPFTNSSVSGNYAGSATTPAKSGVTIFSGEFTADGSSPTGNLTGTADVGNPSGPISGLAFSATYSISSSPTNGRGTVTITSRSGASAVAYVISPSKFVILPLSDANPSVWLFEQFVPPPPPPAIALASLTLNPTTVVGGSQTSTGTVTLTAAAPAGGAQVTLSSSNPAVAQVPSSVTVAPGTTSATFVVTTSAMTTSTSVDISASFGGVTKMASLTVTPPPVTVSSLTLNPTRVVGGLIVGNSTGTVMLNGPAPRGGALVMLSSSNTAVAQVPSSMTIPTGQTMASFTVTTSLVFSSVNVTISASYNSHTVQAVLTVNPVISPPPLPLR